MPVKARVDPERCQSHGICVVTAPGVFDLRDEDGKAFALLDTLAPDEFDAARAAEASCPELAIALEES
jgi:ferredoxin